MGRKSVAELQEELDQERADNARLYAKVGHLRAELAEFRGEDDDDDEEADDD